MSTTASDTDSTAHETDDVAALLDEVQELRDTVADLQDTVTEQQAIIDQQADRIDELEAQVDDVETATQINDTRIDSLDGAIEDHDQAISELQSRELEKDAHLEVASVERYTERSSTVDLRVDGGRLERFTGDDGTAFVRLPDAADPLERSGTSQLATGDLLPIQQVARLDDDMLRANVDALPVRLAARCWRERTSEGEIEPWQRGSSDVRHYLDSSALRAWIRRVEDGISAEYAKKLARRTMAALDDLANGRTYQQKMNRRKDGLRYKETRLILPSDSEIPGERPHQED